MVALPPCLPASAATVAAAVREGWQGGIATWADSPYGRAEAAEEEGRKRGREGEEGGERGGRAVKEAKKDTGGIASGCSVM